MVEYGRLPAGTIEEAMNSLTKANKPIYILESKPVIKAVTGHLNEGLKTSIRDMFDDATLMRREYLKMKGNLKLTTDINQVYESRIVGLRERLMKNTKQLKAYDQEL